MSRLSYQVQTSYFYIDKVELIPVTCTDIENTSILSTTDKSVSFEFIDKKNTQWEYGIVPAGSSSPTISGLSTTLKALTANTDLDNKPLLPNTEYNLYIRSKCDISATFNSWVGPYKFRTKCDVLAIPYDEGFNKSSTTLACWNMIDIDNDATSPTGSNLWRSNTTGAQEGDQYLYFYGSSGKDHNDWLISPTFNLGGGAYKLSYYYKSIHPSNHMFHNLV